MVMVMVVVMVIVVIVMMVVMVMVMMMAFVTCQKILDVVGLERRFDLNVRGDAGQLLHPPLHLVGRGGGGDDVFEILKYDWSRTMKQVI